MAKMALYHSPEYQTSDPWDGTIFYARAVIWTSQLITFSGISVQEKRYDTDFQDNNHLWFPIATTLAINNLQVTPIIPIKFLVIWLYCSGVKNENRFLRRRISRPSWIFDRNNLATFDVTVIRISYQVSSQLALQFRSRSLK